MLHDASSIAAQATPRSVRLADYQPPPFLIDHVALSFELDPAATHVTSVLKLRRNPAAPKDAPLRLDGEALTLLRLARDGETLGDNQYRIEDGALTIPDMPDACELTVETRIAPVENTELSGLYVSNGSFFTQCEAEGFRRITYFPDRPDVMARYTVTITADKAARSGAAVERQSRRAGRPRRRPASHHLDRSASQAVLSVRAGRRRSGVGEGQLHHTVRPSRGPWHLGARGRRGSLRPCDALAEGGDDLGRGSVRAGIRPGCVQHRRGVGLQHGGDGEQGPQCLQHEIRAGAAGNGDRRRLPGHRVGDRARVFPQLDRRSRHLPRLVPVVVEGRADGLSRPGVLRRSGQPRGEADWRRACACVPDSSARMRVRWRIRCSRKATWRSTISTPPRCTRRAPRSSA